VRSMSAGLKEEVLVETTQAETRWNGRSHMSQYVSMSCAVELCQVAGVDTWVGWSPQVRDCVGETVSGRCQVQCADYPQSLNHDVPMRENTPKVWYLVTRFIPSCSRVSLPFMNGCSAGNAKTFEEVRAYV